MAWNEALRGTQPEREPIDLSQRNLNPEIVNPDQLWNLVKGGTHEYISAVDSSYRDGSVVIGPDLGNLSGPPRLAFLRGFATIRMDIQKLGSRSGFYDAVPEDLLRVHIRAADPGLTVDGVNVYQGKEENRKRIAFKTSDSFFYEHPTSIHSLDEFVSVLQNAGKVYIAYAAAYYAQAGLPLPNDRVVFNPEHLLRELEITHARRMFELSYREQQNREGLEGIVILERPQDTFEDVGGQQKAVAVCRRFAKTLQYPETFALEGSRPPRGILLWGPPGTGKTLIARAVANQADAHFLNVTGADIAGEGLYGQTEKATEALFIKAEELARKDDRHVIIFIDEADLVFPGQHVEGATDRHEATGKVVGLVAQKIDGFKTSRDARKITVILAANQPKDLDPRILSRMDENVEVPLPNKEGLSQILKIHLNKIYRISHNIDFAALDLAVLAERAYEQSLSGRDVEDILGIVSRIRGEKQLGLIFAAIDLGKLEIPDGVSKVAFVRELSRRIAAGNIIQEGLRLPSVTTEELLEVVLHAKALLKDKKKGKLGYDTSKETT